MKKIYLFLLIILMIMIFCFSAQPADASTETSSGFCIILAEFIYPDYENYDVSVQNIIADGLDFIVRKTAHFTEYACMGFLWYLYLAEKKYNALTAIGATAFYACTDEFHQLFVEGRAGQIKDVMIDTCGGCFGVLTAFIILCIYYCCTHRKTVSEKGIWHL